MALLGSYTRFAQNLVAFKIYLATILRVYLALGKFLTYLANVNALRMIFIAVPTWPNIEKIISHLVTLFFMHSREI